jgi:hypothetical protein
MSKGNFLDRICIFVYNLVIETAQAHHGDDGGFSWVMEIRKINVLRKYLLLRRTDVENFTSGYYRPELIVFR